MLALARLQTFRPGLGRVGLSATVKVPATISHLLARHPDPCDIVLADPGPAPDIATLIWGLDALDDPTPLFDIAALRDGLDRWLAGNAVMKRTFRATATIAGPIGRNLPGRRKSRRQATFSSDILYDTLAKYDPDHLMLRITRAEAMRGLVDFGRIEDMVARIDGRIDHHQLDRVTPLAAPLLPEVGKVPVKGAAEERLLAEEARALMRQTGLKPGENP